MFAMMGLMMVFMLAAGFALLILVLVFARNSGSMAKRTYFEKPKRHRLSVGDDGELLEIYEDETPLLYDVEAGQ